MNTQLEAKEFVKNEIFVLWPKWNPAPQDVDMWARAFKPFSLEDALAGFQRYYSSEDYTIQRPKLAVVLKHLVRSDNKITTWFWLQNTKSGVYHHHYYTGNKETVLHRLFEAQGAPFGNGSWKKYEESETTHDELFEYRHRKDKGLKSAIEHLESEADAVNIIETYQVDPRSKPSMDIKRALRKLAKREPAIDDIVDDFCKRNKIPIETAHKTEPQELGDDIF